jgi:effector-binding domain-containing protein
LVLAVEAFEKFAVDEQGTGADQGEGAWSRPIFWAACDSAWLQGDDGRMGYEVSLADVESRPAAVVAATTTWQEFPALWGQLLGEVWGCLHAGGIYRGCRNVMLYLDSVPNVEVGVLLDQPCPLIGRVVASALPAGTAAMTVHRGPFGDVGAAHDAVLDWCAGHEYRLDGTRWEVYGPHSDDPAGQWTEVYWLLS